MSYYIRPAPTKLIETGEMVVYRVVKRLRDFQPEEGKDYVVFKSKKEMNNSPFMPVYTGKKGKLVKSPSRFSLRF